MERVVRVDERLRGSAASMNPSPSHSTIVRFERRIGFKRLKTLIDRVIDDLIKRGFIKGLRVVLDAKPFKARYRGDPGNPSRGWLDRDARLGRGVRDLILGYKVHVAGGAETDMPLAFRVAPANQNEKRHAAAFTTKTLNLILNQACAHAKIFSGAMKSP